MFRPHATEKHGIVASLQGLTERLAAPDLTAAEARELRPRLLGLLASLEPGRPLTATDCGTERCAAAS